MLSAASSSCIFVCASQALENIKLVQLEKYHKAKTDFERDSIEVNPTKILYHAVDNCKPLLVTKRVHRGGIVYQVLFCTTDNPFLKLTQMILEEMYKWHLKWLWKPSF